ncbi:MAG TPA: O-methyltransferase [Tepidisphaeraceae bacterium]|jgi:predicted O-methyltransferase YrrM|nr:O-methyltransferase [Tepidisphaeraceae bacterium]
MTSPDLFSIIDHYIDDLFVPEDDVLKSVLRRARTAGLPEIQVSRGQGKFIYLLAKMIGATHLLEIGTLGGYSTIWLARALPEAGRIITLEAEEQHARIAVENIADAGFAKQVQVVVGSAVKTLPQIISRTNEPFDFIFLDADKVSYPTYFTLIMQRVRQGTLILADNVIRKGTVLVPRHDDPSAEAARAFNALIAADQRLEAIVLQQVGVKGHDGLAIARVK